MGQADMENDEIKKVSEELEQLLSGYEAPEPKADKEFVTDNVSEDETGHEPETEED